MDIKDYNFNKDNKRKIVYFEEVGNFPNYIAGIDPYDKEKSKDSFAIHLLPEVAVNEQTYNKNKMKQDKYYTPTIEEFHVGFECEANIENKDWRKTTIEAIPDYIKKYVNKGVYRVKYLDKEDIESLGWKQKEEEDGHILYTQIVPNFCGRLNVEFILQVFGKTWCLIYKPLYEGKLDVGSFVGDIKNKSELKKLMQQLNIIK